MGKLNNVKAPPPALKKPAKKPTKKPAKKAKE